jgi:hypothetical protein
MKGTSMRALCLATLLIPASAALAADQTTEPQNVLLRRQGPGKGAGAGAQFQRYRRRQAQLGRFKQATGRMFQRSGDTRIRCFHHRILIRNTIEPSAPVCIP